MIGPCVSAKCEHRGNLDFVLVLKAEKQLRNGFRYIKELLMQGHNMKLMQAYDRLNESGVKFIQLKLIASPSPRKVKAKPAKF